MMKLSDNLTELNFLRFQDFSLPFNEENSKPAIFSFNGDTYIGFDVGQLNENDLRWAQNRLGLLSGLYGLLRPLDLMQPYRLEMGTKLTNPQGKDLYAFWGDKLTKKLNDTLHTHEQKILINLASNEYFKSVKKKQLNARIITPIFKDAKNGEFKVISFYAKKARGFMARYIMEQQVTTMDKLLAFDSAGYYYSEEHTKKANEPVFLRAEQV